MDIQLIALDLDGTALTSHENISPRLRRDLEAAHAQGVHVVPVTGRQFKMLPPCLPAPWAEYAVLCNGSEVRALPGGAVLAARYMGPELLLDHLPLFLDELDLTVELSGHGYLHTTAALRDRILASPINPFHPEVLAKRGILVPDLYEFVRSDPYPFDKLNLPYVPPQQHDELERLMESLPFSGVWSGPNSMEVTHAEATKGSGLLTVCGILGIEPGRAMAIGDSGNDVPMLKAAGLGVAMGSAPDRVKAAADAVTLTNAEDGAAAAIERYVLGR